jgi:DNA-binding XRE family transcriptional regulator
MTAKKFKKWRRDMGWTQIEAAENLGVTSKTISNWECDVERVRLVVKLATERLTDLAD